MSKIMIAVVVALCASNLAEAGGKARAAYVLKGAEGVYRLAENSSSSCDRNEITATYDKENSSFHLDSPYISSMYGISFADINKGTVHRSVGGMERVYTKAKLAGTKKGGMLTDYHKNCDTFMFGCDDWQVISKIEIYDGRIRIFRVNTLAASCTYQKVSE